MVEKDVAELRARVAQLEFALDYVSKHLGIQIPAAPAPSGVSQRVIALVRANHKIEAIKAHMEETGLDLVRAKKAIEGIE